MRDCASYSVEDFASCEMDSNVQTEEFHDRWDEQPTSTTIAWAVRGASHREPVVQVALRTATRRAWAVTDPRTPGHDSCARGWASRQGHVGRVPAGPSSHRIALYSKSYPEWAAGVTHSSLQSPSSAGNSTPAASDVSYRRQVMPQGARTGIVGHNPSTEVFEVRQQQPQPQQPTASQEARHKQQPQQQQPRTQRTPHALPLSVPTLAIGDVFLSCNTVVGLEHADDWDHGALGNGLVAEPGASGASPPGGSTSSSPSLGARHSSRLEIASELLLRMSPPAGGQRLMFVSKESAELVRRAMLLIRYDEIMTKRRAASEDATDGAAAASSASERPGAIMSWGRVPGPAAEQGTAAAGAGSAASAAAASSTTVSGSVAHGPRFPFATWLGSGKLSTKSADQAPGTATCSPPPPARSKMSASTSHSSAALLSSRTPGSAGSGGGAASSAGGAVVTSADSASDLASWVPEPVREVAAAAARGLGGWLGIGDGGRGSAAVGGGGSVSQGLAALFKRGVEGESGGALDVSGPRPRLPAAPLTVPMPIPQLGTPAAAAAVGNDEPRQRQQPVEGAAEGAPAVPTVGRWALGLLRGLQQLEEEKVIADAEALLRSGKGSGAAAAVGGGDGFLPPFSFSSYVARLPLADALKVLVCTATTSTAAPAAAAAAAVPTEAVASAAAGAAPAAPVRRRFLLVPDSADEQAVEGSREVDRLVAEMEATEAEAREAPELRHRADVAAAATAAAGGTAVGLATAAAGRRAVARPRVALNLYDSDSSHGVLDVVDELEQDGSEAASAGSNSGSSNSGSSNSGSSNSGSSNSSSSSGSQATSLPAERFLRGSSSGPSEDLGGLVQLTGPLEPAASSSASSFHSSRALVPSKRRSTAAASAAFQGHESYDSGNSSSIDGGASTGRSSNNGSSSSSGGGGGDGRTPVFFLPGITVSIRALDGTLLRLRPAFLSLQQLAAALALARDAAAAAWRRQRSVARWKVVSALDVLTVHSAGFPITRAPPLSSSSAAAGGGGGDEDSDDGIPEAKELLREMGAGNRRPTAADVAAAAAAPQSPPSGPLGVLSTLAVGVVSFSAWCLASAVDVWEDVYSRTPGGLEEIGVPQHVNVTPTYLEEHVRQLAAANAPAVAAAAAAARSRAVLRAQEHRARRRQAQAQGQAQRQEQEEQQQAQSASDSAVGKEQQRQQPKLQRQQAHGQAGADRHDRGAATPGASCGAAASVMGTRSASSEPSNGVAGATAPAIGPTSSSSAAAAAAATASASFGGLSLQTETIAGLAVLLQLACVAARAAHARAQRQADGIWEGDAGSGGGSVDGLLRFAASGRSSRDGGVGAVAGGGGGLTLTASQDGELGIVARLDTRPVVVKAAAASSAEVVTPSSAAASAAAGSTAATVSGLQAVPGEPPAEAGADSATPQQQGQQQASSSYTSAAAAVTASTDVAASGALKPGGMSIRQVAAAAQPSGLRYEALWSSTKPASQVTRPHKFEVGLHLNLRKLLGDLPADAPDQLLKLQQPAGAAPIVAAAATGSGAGANGGGRRNGGPAAQSPAPEAYGLLLIGDLGLEDFGGGPAFRAPPLGFADLGGLLPPPGPAGSRSGLSAAALGGDVGGGRWGGSSSEESSKSGEGAGPAGGGGGFCGGLDGESRSGEAVAAAAGAGSRGWAAWGSKRGGWGRWGR